MPVEGAAVARPVAAHVRTRRRTNLRNDAKSRPQPLNNAGPGVLRKDRAPLLVAGHGALAVRYAENPRACGRAQKAAPFRLFDGGIA